MNDSNEQQDITTEPSQKAPPSALAVFCAGGAVVVSAVIAFCCTCAPLSLVFFGMQGGVLPRENKNPRQLAMTEWGELLFYSACAVGIFVALLTGYLVYRAIQKHWRKQ